MTAPGAPIPPWEWLRRYQDRLMAVAHLTRDQAVAASQAEDFDILSEDYEDDPEGAADMEMSYRSD